MNVIKASLGPRPQRPCGWFAEDSASQQGIRSPLSARFAAESAHRRPFVLLDDQMRNCTEFLTNEKRVFRADRFEEVSPILSEMQSALAEGAKLYGFVAYDAAPAFDPDLATNGFPFEFAPATPLLWFAEFADCFRGGLQSCGQDKVGVQWIPQVDAAAYVATVSKALERIRSGDIYQVNLSLPMTAHIVDPVDWYLFVRHRARAPFGAFVDTGDSQVMSFSPEMFFDVSGRTISARPMKGTRARSEHSKLDRQLRDDLRVGFGTHDRRANLRIMSMEAAA